jgi:hypothetical protein
MERGQRAGLQGERRRAAAQHQCVRHSNASIPTGVRDPL